MRDEMLLIAETDGNGEVVWVWYYSASKKLFRSARTMPAADLHEVPIVGGDPRNVCDWIGQPG